MAITGKGDFPVVSGWLRATRLYRQVSYQSDTASTTIWRDYFFEVVAGSAHSVTVPLGTMVVTGQTPGATVLERNYSATPLGTIVATGNVPGATVLERNYSGTPLGTLVITGNVPSETVTERNYSATPLGTITTAGNVPGATTTEGAAIALPLGTLTASGIAPTATSSEHVVTTGVLGTLTLGANTPNATVTTSDGHTSTLFGTTTALTGYAPSFELRTRRRVTATTATPRSRKEAKRKDIRQEDESVPAIVATPMLPAVAAKITARIDEVPDMLIDVDDDETILMLALMI